MMMNWLNLQLTNLVLTQKMGKKRENSYQMLKRSLEERHTERIQNILTITDVFLNQNKVNV